MSSILSNAGAVVAAAFGVQVLAGIPAIAYQTEKFYDLTGSLTFIGCTILSLYLPAIRAKQPLPSILSFHPRQLIFSSFTVLWAARLGTFLFDRVHSSPGGDTRFDEIKKSPPKFAFAWFAQGAWVSFTAFPVFALNSIPRNYQPKLGRIDAIAALLWAGAFSVEVIADRQKSAWREGRTNKTHDEKFISHGLWSLSRHPNYVGEVTLWGAQALVAASALAAVPALVPTAAALGMFCSPLAEYALIRYVSGVSISEKSADEKLGGDAKYEEYKRNTPIFFPNPFKKLL